MRRLTLGVLGGLALAGLLFAQPLTDPWWRPLNPGGGSAGVTYGTVLPSLATTGTNPGQGELAIDSNGATDGGPLLQIWDHVNNEWDLFLTTDLTGTLTANTVVKTNAAGTALTDSSITDNAVDVVATGGLFTVGTALGGANSIQIDGTTSMIVAEGAVNDFELQVTLASVAADRIFAIPDYGVDVAPFVSVGGVIPGNPNCVWAANNALVFEGATANAFELVIAPTDVGQLQTVTVPDIFEAAGSFVLTTLDAGANDLGDANAAWFGSGTLTFEGSAADAFELTLTAGGFGSDVGLTFASPLAGGSGDLMTLASTILAMDNADTVRGLFIDITNADHGGAGNLLYGIDVDVIVGDAQATEVAINIGSGWDQGVLLPAGSVGTPALGFTADPNTGLYSGGNDDVYIASGSTGIGYWLKLGANASGSTWNFGNNYTLSAANGSDIRNVVSIDVTQANPSGAGNVLRGLYVDAIVEDPDDYEASIYVADGWDSHFTLDAMEAAPAENPPAGTVSFILDDNVDYSGAGGADCCLIARTSGGVTVVIATIVLNGACP